MCSPLRCRPLKRFHSSGRWFFGSHCPNSSRKEYTRSLARALSSSRRPPPNTASKPYSSIESRSVTLCSRLRMAFGPGSSVTRPASIDAWTDPTTSGDTELGDPAVPVVEDLGEVVAGVDVHQREGDAGGPEGLLGDLQHHRGVLAAGEEQHGVLELGRDLTEDVDRLGLERVEMRDRGVRHPATPAPGSRPNGRRDCSRAP